jgi:menaquinone-dependent protoporphyrinogen oxidase
MRLHIVCVLFMTFFTLIIFSVYGNSEIKFIETSYGEDKIVSKKILVTYVTRAGSTAEVADFIGKTLSDKGAVVDVKPLYNVRDINNYQAIVLGTAIRKGGVLPEAIKFVKAHKSELEKIPVLYFVVCMTLKDNTEENLTKVNAYLDPLRAEIIPVDSGLFAGKMDYSKLSFLDLMIIKYMVKTPEGDYRDWKAIKTWTDNLFPKLISLKK